MDKYFSSKTPRGLALKTDALLRHYPVACCVFFTLDLACGHELFSSQQCLWDVCCIYFPCAICQSALWFGETIRCNFFPEAQPALPHESWINTQLSCLQIIKYS